jgi:hypothetical protein
MHAHFLLCSACREELRQKSIALAAYGAAVPQGFVPIGARERFFDSLSSTEQAGHQQASKQFSLRFMQRLAPYFLWLGKGRWVSVLAVLLAIALFYVSIEYYRIAAQFKTFNTQARQGEIDSARMNELLDLLISAKAQRNELRQTPTLLPPPEGHVMYSPENGTLYFTGSSLHALAVGKSYELWILRTNNQPPIAVGAFTPDNNGFATLVPPTLPDHLNILGYVVTIEDSAGATTPTQPYVMTSMQER